MVLNASFSNISDFWGRKPEYTKKTTDLSQITDLTFSHNVVSSTPRNERDSNLHI